MARELNDLEKRLIALLKRHLREEDASLSDRDLVLRVQERYARYLKEEIVDVSE